MGTISDLLAEKGAQVHTINPGATVFDAVRAMVDHNVGSLIVSDERGTCGIITERDYLRRVVLQGRTSKTTQVREIMTSKLVCVDPESTIEKCMAIMSAKRIRHLPVIRDGEMVGLVSIGDLVRRVTREQEFEIRYLTDYITGKYPA